MTKTQFDASGHIRGVTASGGSLIRATLGAAVAAGVILTVFWLPAEYGIDPTGLGRTMGLTKMGEIKQGLYAEAEAEKTKPVTDPQILNRLDAIEAQLAALVANGGVVVTEKAAPAEASEWRDTWSFTLEPEDSIEAKLKMTEGQQATFEWTANGGLLNYDMHGDGGGEISYEQGRNQPGQSGVLTAAFDGNHGWYWRNRTDQDVTFTLHVRGDYERLLTP
ncbi:transmembrane anchor protein [Donghicola mangrovi]|uniref:transmembrane anchor protein n=1 Tax=Donghicola mangrovi TaxID=2729614 RepID=UPI001D152881|nr:transmembrane anchor protein [Donghicola mangrovi]